MSAIIETSGGKITYTDDCIASIAGKATTECYGVVGMSPVNKMKDSLADILAKENVKRGVRVYTDGTNAISVELYVIVQYGVSISAVASSIISTVRYNLEKNTGLNINDVKVLVSGIRVGQ